MPRFTKDDLLAKDFIATPNGWAKRPKLIGDIPAFNPPFGSHWLPDSITQHYAGEKPLDSNQDESRSRGRVKVCIERRGSKLLDKDNLYGGVKFACDALRYAKLIKEDDPESIELIVTQRKVPRKEVGTEITITYL